MSVQHNIRLYDPTNDEMGVLKQWQAALGQRWPIDPRFFRQNVAEASIALVAERNGETSGFICAHFQQEKGAESPDGFITTLFVRPDHRRQGMGRELLEAALEDLSRKGVKRVQTGIGPSYIWPGAPLDPPEGWLFFKACGFREKERSFDLTQRLDGYATPTWVWERLRPLGVEIIKATREDELMVNTFMDDNFPYFAPYYKRAFDEQRPQEILLARRGEEILGGCLVEAETLRWTSQFDGPMGAPGAVCVAESAQGQGIGMALAARGTELLQAAGFRHSFIGYTWLVDWYGKLGYRVWQEYVIGWKDIRLNTQ